MKLVIAALRNPHAVIVFMLFLIVIGITALLRIPADLLPIFKTPAIQVVTLYPGSRTRKTLLDANDFLFENADHSTRPKRTVRQGEIDQTEQIDGCLVNNRSELPNL